MDIKNHYDFHGPFQISNGLAYIKNTYVPFELGSHELDQVIKNNRNKLETELMKWVLLDELNTTELNGKAEHDPSD
tara:strand:+ start:6695 stop:6922 length:228 start_codon:yes stop_codon:yes gene_type:complete